MLAASASLAERRVSKYDYTPLRVAAQLGLRQGEVLGLRWRDFDRDARLLHVSCQLTTVREFADEDEGGCSADRDPGGSLQAAERAAAAERLLP